MHKPRLAIVSPFIDKSHGTERHLAEWLPRLVEHYEIHVYSQRVEDVDLSRIRWHRIPFIPIPHLFGYTFWFAANHLYRWWDRTFFGLEYDLVFSPGINCWDADVVSVHVIFADVCEAMKDNLRLGWHCIGSWPRIVHRWLYYRLIVGLERQVFTNARTKLIAISIKTAADVKRFYGGDEDLPINYAGIDCQAFNPQTCGERRSAARQELDLPCDAFVLLLIGNAWHNKGLHNVLDALKQLGELPVRLLVVGKDDPRCFQEQVRRLNLEGRVLFLPHRSDVIAYYAAADAYVGASLSEAFAQPIAEAMASGLPVIASAKAGASEIITDGVDGLILKDPQNVEELAGWIKYLYNDAALRQRLGAAAAKTTAHYTWDHSASQFVAVLEHSRQSRGARAYSAVKELL